jgi:hypothetical protein
MTQQQKLEIQYKLRIYVSTFTSQKKASQSIEGVSESYIICMLNPTKECWDSISDAMWRNVAAQVGGVVDFNTLVETQNFQTLTLYYELAKQEGAAFAIVGNAGWGKSYTAKWYSAANRINNVFYLECAEFMDRKTFLKRLLMQMGESYYGFGLAEMMEAVVRKMRKMDKPLIIMDEIDKLPDQVFKFFITFYNELNKKCGFIWQSTNAIEKRMTRGLNKNVTGYQELYSRIGATFLNLNMPSREEVAEICQANNITNPEAIATIWNQVKEVGGDLRRVDRNILKTKVKNMRNKLKTAV